MGPKIPKRLDVAALMRVRDVDAALIGAAQCQNVSICTEDIIVMAWAYLVRGVSPADILRNMLPLAATDIPKWMKMCDVVEQALCMRKQDAVAALKPMRHCSLGHRMLHMVRALVGFSALDEVFYVRLPYADWLRQVVAQHKAHGHHWEPLLGTGVRAYTATQTAGTSPDELAASVLQQYMRRTLVRSWYDLQLTAYFCGVCGHIQLPPRQRVLYVPELQGDGSVENWCVVCGAARKLKRNEYDKRARGGPRRRNEDKRMRNLLWARMCEGAPCAKFNLLGSGLFMGGRLYQACTQCPVVCAVESQQWTEGVSSK